jgi:hypothetical protein
VVDAIEGFPGVQEKDKVLLFFGKIGIVQLINIKNKICHDPARDKKFLIRRNKSLYGRGNTKYQNARDNTIIRIVDRDGSCILGKEGGGLRNQMQESEVKLGREWMALDAVEEESQKERRSQLDEVAVSHEGDTIRSCRGVAATQDGSDREGHSGG